jgi:N6-adenosine-specific RNA methylase IME4
MTVSISDEGYKVNFSKVIKIKDIVLGDRFRKDLGDLKGLADSIKEVGLLQPPVVNEDNELICGARRIEAYVMAYPKEKEIPVTVVSLKDILSGEFHENSHRKQFTSTETIEIKHELEKREAAEAKKRQGQRTDLLEHSVQFTESWDTRDKVAGYLGMSWKTLDKLEDIVNAAKENPLQFGDLPEKIDSGKVSINYANMMITRAEDHSTENIPELPQGQFDVISADPPWDYHHANRGAPDNHYAVMTDQDIENLQIPSAENAVLFLWAPIAKLPTVLKVMEKWGFDFKTGAVWIKDKIGIGYYFRGQCELLLLGTKGKMPLPQESTRPSQYIIAERNEHSAKPNEVYGMIEQMYPNRKYLELFARKKHSDKWTAWGNEVAEGEELEK